MAVLRTNDWPRMILPHALGMITSGIKPKISVARRSQGEAARPRGDDSLKVIRSTFLLIHRAAVGKRSASSASVSNRPSDSRVTDRAIDSKNSKRGIARERLAVLTDHGESGSVRAISQGQKNRNRQGCSLPVPLLNKVGLFGACLPTWRRKRVLSLIRPQPPCAWQ